MLGKTQTLAVVLSNVAYLTYPIPVIQKVINAGNLGRQWSLFLWAGEDQEYNCYNRGEKNKHHRSDTLYILCLHHAHNTSNCRESVLDVVSTQDAKSAQDTVGTE